MGIYLLLLYLKKKKKTKGMFLSIPYKGEKNIQREHDPVTPSVPSGKLPGEKGEGDTGGGGSFCSRRKGGK